MPLSRNRLAEFLDALLNPGAFADYGPNGLQIEGREEIRRVAFAASATAKSVAAAADWGADALVVHHGLFWKFHGTRPLTGTFARRVFPLVRHQISLFAYHLPLDAHPEVGNAAVLGSLIGLSGQSPFGDHQGCPTGVRGVLSPPTSAGALRDRLAEILEHGVMLATPDASALVSAVGIITGGANGGWAEAAKAGLDAYITGEMSEHDWHEAQEAGIHMYAGGHNATERFGIQALMERVEREFGVECQFIPSDNPA
ncbi:MAG: Nif3-like dinuclear metal center hexameric protein [Methylococcus sp.]|nr:Nif3-like dinuclear metal center hexameric protein [Methylococcus sp.]